jgi:dipeptidyl-peptidase-4
MANEISHPEAVSAWKWTPNSLEALTALDGNHSIAIGGPTRVVRRASINLVRATTTVSTTLHGATADHIIESFSEEALVQPNVQFIRAGKRQIPCALILPRDIKPGTKLPVLMDPYGGPHAQRVVDSYTAHCTSQWFADQGFAVLVVDGRGTPGLGTEWEHSVYLDLATAVLEDQVDALHAVAADHPELDLDRVAIRGWSFGGYLAALAVLRRPDVFHSAVAGAPVTEWRLYDTFYTERYLGNPAVDVAPYDATSLINEAHKLSRPLLLVHGLADDNVVAAHTLQFSSALLAAGKPHEVLPLSGVTHMTPQAVVAENLLLHQLDFLRRTL